MGGYVDSAIAFLQANPLVAGTAVLVLFCLLVRRTAVFLFLLLLAAVLGVVLYLIADVAGIGGAAKRKMIDQTPAGDVR